MLAAQNPPLVPIAPKSLIHPIKLPDLVVKDRPQQPPWPLPTPSTLLANLLSFPTHPAHSCLWGFAVTAPSSRALSLEVQPCSLSHREVPLKSSAHHCRTTFLKMAPSSPAPSFSHLLSCCIFLIASLVFWNNVIKLFMYQLIKSATEKCKISYVENITISLPA